MKSRDIYWRRYKIQETLYVGQWCPSPLQSRHLGTSHSSSCHQLSCRIFLNLINGLKSLPSTFGKVILVWGKARNCRAPNLGCWGTESPGWFDVLPNNSAHYVMHEAANHQLSRAAAFWIIPVVSVEEYSSLTQNLMQIRCSTRSVILNNSHTVHMLTQQCLPPPLTSTVKPSLFTQAHSSPLSLAARSHWCCANHSCYINSSWTSSRQTLYSILVLALSL